MLLLKQDEIERQLQLLTEQPFFIRLEESHRMVMWGRLGIVHSLPQQYELISNTDGYKVNTFLFTLEDVTIVKFDDRMVTWCVFLMERCLPQR